MSTYYKFFVLAFLTTTILFTSCGEDDTVIEGGEELITTVTLVLQPTSGGTAQSVTFADLDGDGGNDPVIGTLSLEANTTYTTAISLLNEAATPVETIDMEVREEDDEHQFFFATSNGLNLSVAYQDQDGDGNPLGLLTTFTTGDVSTGDLTVTLRHEPNKSAAGVADGDITNAGGETDIEVVFPTVIE